MSRTLRFEWNVPDELFDERFREEEFLTQLKEDAVIKLFTAGRLSSGYAASLLGMTRRDFLERLQGRVCRLCSIRRRRSPRTSRPCKRSRGNAWESSGRPGKRAECA